MAVGVAGGGAPVGVTAGATPDAAPAVGVSLRTSDLGRLRRESGPVIAVEELGDGIVEMVAALPVLAASARAGEFAQLGCGEGLAPLLRRPMSVARAREGTVAFVFERVGAGTRALARLRPGEPLDVLGPLGVGFTMPAPGGRAVCVAGGLGCAPFPLAAASALAAGAEGVTVLSGAATASRLYPGARYGGGDARVTVVEATDDGSRGHRGPVTELVAAELERGGVSALWACGPNAMLAALARLLESLRERRGAGSLPAVCEASMEAPMGCGFGTCLGCALPVRAGAGAWALCCRQGPVMPVDAVDWSGVAALPPPSVA